MRYGALRASAGQPHIVAIAGFTTNRDMSTSMMMPRPGMRYFPGNNTMCLEPLPLFSVAMTAAGSFPDETSIAGSLGNAGAWIAHVTLATDNSYWPVMQA